RLTASPRPLSGMSTPAWSATPSSLLSSKSSAPRVTAAEPGSSPKNRNSAGPAPRYGDTPAGLKWYLSVTVAGISLASETSSAPGRPAIPSTSCCVTQQIVSTDTAGVKKYSTATVGTTLSLASVCSAAGSPTRSVSTESISPSGSTAVASSLTWT